MHAFDLAPALDRPRHRRKDEARRALGLSCRTNQPPRRPLDFPENAFLPSNLAGLAAWYRADLLLTQVAGKVSGWGDSSGSGDANRNLIQLAPALQPSYTASDAAYNNHPSVTFVSAAAQTLQPTGRWSAALAQPFSLYIVGNSDGSPAPQNLTGEPGGRVQVVDNNGGAGVNLYAGAFLNAGLENTAAPRIVAANFNGATSKVYQSALTAAATGPTGAYGCSRVAISDTAVAGLNGKIVEAIYYSRTLSAAEHQRVMTYLGTRYAIAVGP